MTSFLIPVLLASIGMCALYQKIPVYQTFLAGAKNGLQTSVGLLPTLVGLLTAVYMLRASGFIDIATHMLAPVLHILGVPQECAALVLLKPFSGSGGLALGSEIIKHAGVDSYVGRVAAVMLGASETSIFTIGVYSGHLNLCDTKYVIPAALIGDIAAFAAAAFFVRVLL